MPQVRLETTTLAGSGVTLDTTSDVFVDATTYEAVHAVTATCSSVVDRSTTRYLAKLQNEFGANSVSGLLVYGCSYTCTVTAYTEA